MKTKRSAIRPMTVLAVIFAVGLVFIVAWVSLYPSAGDPKNIKYVLWKAGLYRLNQDIATDTMIGDSGRDKLVLGKTKVQLEEKFGYLLIPADASEYLRHCYQKSSWDGRDVFFIRQSPWMVVFDHDKATTLVLIKGC